MKWRHYDVNLEASQSSTPIGSTAPINYTCTQRIRKFAPCWNRKIYIWRKKFILWQGLVYDPAGLRWKSHSSTKSKKLKASNSRPNITIRRQQKEVIKAGYTNTNIQIQIYKCKFKKKTKRGDQSWMSYLSPCLCNSSVFAFSIQSFSSCPVESRYIIFFPYFCIFYFAFWIQSFSSWPVESTYIICP